MTPRYSIPRGRTQWDGPAMNHLADAVAEVQDAEAESELVLAWDPLLFDYAPAESKGRTDRPKKFVGPTDPSGVAGVVLSTYDVWEST